MDLLIGYRNLKDQQDRDSLLPPPGSEDISDFLLCLWSTDRDQPTLVGLFSLCIG